MNVLVACEESQAVCKAFRAKGHNAFSCDLQECSGGHPEWHIRGNVYYVVLPKFYNLERDKRIDFVTQDGQLHFVPEWDLVIAHPPCTYLSKVAAGHLYHNGVLDENRFQHGLSAREFFMFFYHLDVKHICIENPVPFRIFQLPRQSQVIEPYFFGDPYKKKTYLWLKGLNPLISTNIVVPLTHWHNSGGSCSGVASSSKLRSKTFPGVAAAMAEQWGCLV